MSLCSQVEKLQDRRWRLKGDRGVRRKTEGVEETKEKNIVSLMKDLGLSPGTLLVRCIILGELLRPPELHFLHLLNEYNKLHKTVALKLELERASESPGGLLKQIPRLYSTLKDSNSAGLGWAPKIRISNKFLDDADTAVLATLWDPLIS